MDNLSEKISTAIFEFNNFGLNECDPSSFGKYIAGIGGDLETLSMTLAVGCSMRGWRSDSDESKLAIAAFEDALI